ncbi:hypothetical protein [Streptomyces sp. NPDC059071]|uniref:hypothetical protein n=1 Tax=unclassified Streptomyces TaxID=2593676 RepID=UPI003668C183
MSTPDELEPLVVRWDRTVIPPDDPREDTIVCCLTDDGRPVALVLDDEQRERLGLELVLPNGNGYLVSSDLDGTTYVLPAEHQEQVDGF